MPLAAVATDVLSGDDVLLSTGNALEGILASCAIPGTFAPVEIDGRVLMDGGVVSSTRISHAVALGADVVWVPVAHCFTRTAAPTTVLGMALLALTLLLNQRLALDVERFESAVELWVLPPLCGVPISPADFSHADDLIARAHDSTRRWLAASPHPRRGQARQLRPHGAAGTSTDRVEDRRDADNRLGSGGAVTRWAGGTEQNGPTVNVAHADPDFVPA